VQSGTPAGQLSVPAVHVGLGPGVRADHVEFISGPATHGSWLFAYGDIVVAKVIPPAGAMLVLTSLRGPGGEVLSITVQRLDARGEPGVPEAAAPVLPANNCAAGTPSLAVSTHIRTRGDMRFIDAPWAGRVAPGLWIESFSLRPLAHLEAADLEYKGLTGSGFETPWISDDKPCGTKGMAVPLVGFAVRAKSAAAVDCEYSGYFQSGQIVGPLKNGAPCRSSVASDPLEGMQIRLVPRAAVNPAPTRAATKANGRSAAARSKARPRSNRRS